MITAPQVKGNKLKFVQLSQLESDKILAVIVMEGNIIRNKVIDVSEALSQENKAEHSVKYYTDGADIGTDEFKHRIQDGESGRRAYAAC